MLALKCGTHFFPNQILNFHDILPKLVGRKANPILVTLWIKIVDSLTLQLIFSFDFEIFSWFDFVIKKVGGSKYQYFCYKTHNVPVILGCFARNYKTHNFPVILGFFARNYRYFWLMTRNFQEKCSGNTAIVTLSNKNN